jgi:hypothetical protein
MVSNIRLPFWSWSEESQSHDSVDAVCLASSACDQVDDEIAESSFSVRLKPLHVSDTTNAPVRANFVVCVERERANVLAVEEVIGQLCV